MSMRKKQLTKDISPEERPNVFDDLRLNNNVIMEYQQIINVLDNTPNQLSKFRTENWIEINDDSGGTYNTNSQT